MTRTKGIIRESKPERLVNDKKQTNHRDSRTKELISGALRRNLEKTSSLNPPDIEATPIDLPIDVTPTTIVEISIALRQIKSGEDAGPDNIIDTQGGSDANSKTRIDKERAAFPQLKNIWNSEQLSANIKIRIFNTNVKTVLLYGAETWRITTTIIKSTSIYEQLST
ncbi:unnamed protein product [Schistosoma curassoni]|uniref:DUF6451 domain-containing protein n=1 Tax=Schistosoma curassoni TaxID=6186 RepID=A0A183L398_9TREM|nr:unnamed protein product [Schistosoma curassoni]